MTNILLIILFLTAQIKTITSNNDNDNNNNYKLRDYRICNLKEKEVLLEFESNPNNISNTNEYEDVNVISSTSKPIVLIDDIKGFIHDAIMTNTKTLTISNNNYTNEILGNYSTNNILVTNDNNNKIRIIAKQCSCDSETLFSSIKNPETNSNDNDYYCMNGNYCGIYQYSNRNQNEIPSVICFDFSVKSVFVKNIFPVILLWYVALFTFFFVSNTGTHVRNYIKSFYITNLNERLVDNRIQNELYILRYQQQMLLNRRRLSLPLTSNNNNNGDDNGAGATILHDNEQLVLKVKTFFYPDNNIINSSNDEDDDGNKEEIELDSKVDNEHNKEECIIINNEENKNEEENDENNKEEIICCTICMITIDNGDKIGALSCNHKFHVHCLKQWLCRRNVCPLCLTPDIATIRTIENHNSSNNTATTTTTTNPRYNATNHPSLLLLTANNYNHHNLLAGSGIATGSVNMIASTFLNLDNVTSSIQHSFFGSNNNNRDNDTNDVNNMNHDDDHV